MNRKEREDGNSRKVNAIEFAETNFLNVAKNRLLKPEIGTGNLFGIPTIPNDMPFSEEEIAAFEAANFDK